MPESIGRDSPGWGSDRDASERQFELVTPDFSAKKYLLLCEKLRTASCGSIQFKDYVTKRKESVNGRLAVLRHDVDRFAYTALALARIEHSLGLTATYYFRVPSTFRPRIISEIRDLGHEIGLHYEVLDKARGDIILARHYLVDDLKRLREIAPVETVAMHGNPLTPFDNRDIWKQLELSEFGLIGEAYLSVDFNQIDYFSDTGRTWKRNRFNIYDRLPSDSESVEADPTPRSTDELINVIQTSNKDLYLLTHPERWPDSPGGWLLSYIWDLAVNPMKIASQTVYQLRGKE